MEDEVNNLIKVCVLIFTSLSYCYFIAKKIPEGKIRLLSLSPIFSLFTILPLQVSTINLKGIISFFITWLANFKLLLFSFNKGPLSSASSNSLKNFICIACLPIKIKQNPSPQITQTPPKSTLKGFTIKFLLFCLLLRVYVYKELLNQTVLSGLYCVHIFIALELLLAMGAALAQAMLGLELEPQTDKPYLATSLQDFWGRRWNLMITSILRPTVYDPMRCICIRILGRRWSSLPAVLATFIVSGLMHELVFYHLIGIRPTWEVTWFFVLHGICTSVEIAVKKALSGRWRLHPVISGTLAIGFVLVTSLWLFLPPVLRGGGGANVWGIDEYAPFLEYLKQKVVFSSYSLVD